MPDPALVLCMAGLYRRFRDAGYTTPKFLLPIGPKGGAEPLPGPHPGEETLLARIARLLPAPELLLVANERDRRHEDAIRASVSPGADLIFVGDTSGQAETAAIGARRLQARWDGPVLFHNVDTLVIGRDLGRIGRILERADGFVDVFDNDSPAYSYVAVDGVRVTAIAEKVVISRHATTGLYGFRSCATYVDACAATTTRSRGEFYVSDVYRTLLERGGVVEIDPPREGQDTVVLGTPEEYERWRAGQ